MGFLWPPDLTGVSLKPDPRSRLRVGRQLRGAEPARAKSAASLAGEHGVRPWSRDGGAGDRAALILVRPEPFPNDGETRRGPCPRPCHPTDSLQVLGRIADRGDHDEDQFEPVITRSLRSRRPGRANSFRCPCQFRNRASCAAARSSFLDAGLTFERRRRLMACQMSTVRAAARCSCVEWKVAHEGNVNRCLRHSEDRVARLSAECRVGTACERDRRIVRPNATCPAGREFSSDERSSICRPRQWRQGRLDIYPNGLRA